MHRKTSILLSLGFSAVLIAAAIWLLDWHTVGLWPVNGRWGMGHHMLGGGIGGIMILFWVVLIGALVLLVSGIINGIRGSRQDDAQETPLEILKRRYALGEIDKAEFEDKCRHLSA
jgi:putative membrane protein